VENFIKTIDIYGEMVDHEGNEICSLQLFTYSTQGYPNIMIYHCPGKTNRG